MKINDAVARLVRAGDENSAMWKKIGAAIDELGAELAKYFPGGGEQNELPRNVIFQHWPSGEYHLEFTTRSGLRGSIMRGSKKYHEFVLDFCKEVAGGWLDEVSAILEKDNNALTRAGWNIRKFTTKPKT